MKKIGAITIGQSPRVDITYDINPILGDKIDLVEIGALDNLTKEELSSLTPKEEGEILVSKLRDGTYATFSKSYVIPKLQECIYHLESQGVEAILFLCTGAFGNSFKSSIPLIFPCDVLNALIPVLSHNKDIIVITPKKEQVSQTISKWDSIVKKVDVIVANPYGEWSEIEELIPQIEKSTGDIIILDCMGYSVKMKEFLIEKTNKKVVLARTLMAYILKDILI